MNIVAIIPARGGSKGIKKKNLTKFCNKPLLYWTINRCLQSRKINSTWVTSNDEEILKYAKKNKANIIRRPKLISNSKSISEDAIIHAIKKIEKKINISHIVFPQVTSPIREKNEFDIAINYYLKNKFNSMFSADKIRDYFIWEKNNQKINPLNYSLNKRPPRQIINEKFHENGSFYIFEKKGFLKNKIRVFDKIGIYEMKQYKSLQIDEPEDIKLAEVIMKNYILHD